MLGQPKLPPDAPLKALGHRARILAALPAAAGRRDRTSKAIATALRSTALARPAPEERPWIRRIEARRAAVAALRGVRTPDEVGVYDIALAVQWMSVPPVLGRLLLHLVRELRPDSCLEVGTGFGISGAYIGAGLELAAAGRLLTVDVDPRPSAIAAEGFEELGLARVEADAGPSPETLACALERSGPVDLAFIDADHQRSATLDTLDALRPRLGSGSVVVLDDISDSWSEMKGAWATIISDEAVVHRLALGRLGIVTYG